MNKTTKKMILGGIFFFANGIFFSYSDRFNYCYKNHPESILRSDHPTGFFVVASCSIATGVLLLLWSLYINIRSKPRKPRSGENL